MGSGVVAVAPSRKQGHHVGLRFSSISTTSSKTSGEAYLADSSFGTNDTAASSPEEDQDVCNVLNVSISKAEQEVRLMALTAV